MNRIQSIVEGCSNYIESHLREKFALEDIADNNGISKYYLHRIFKSLTGESLIRYATSRKLAESIHELMHTRRKILDIALDYGFEHEQSYIRAFKKEFGQTPLKIRKSGQVIPIRERINIHDFATVGEAAAYRPFFVVKPAFYLVGIEHAVPLNADYLTANHVGRDFFYNHQSRIANVIRPEVYFGYVDWSPVNQGYTIYCPSAQVAGLVEIPPGMTGRLIPAHKYVVFRFIGFFHPEQINLRHFSHLLEYMYSKWVFQAGYDFAAQYRFEYIDNGIAKNDYCELDIYQPIKNLENPAQTQRSLLAGISDLLEEVVPRN